MLAAGHMLVRQMLGLEEGEETEIQIANNTRRIRIEKTSSRKKRLQPIEFKSAGLSRNRPR